MAKIKHFKALEEMNTTYLKIQTPLGPDIFLASLTELLICGCIEHFGKSFSTEVDFSTILDEQEDGTTRKKVCLFIFIS